MARRAHVGSRRGPQLLARRLAQIQRLEHRHDLRRRRIHPAAQDLLEHELPAPDRVGAILLRHRRQQRRLRQQAHALAGIQLDALPHVVARRSGDAVELRERPVHVGVVGQQHVRERAVVLEQRLAQELIRLLRHVIREQRIEVGERVLVLGQRRRRVRSQPHQVEPHQVRLRARQRQQPARLLDQLVGRPELVGIGRRGQLRVGNRAGEEIRQPAPPSPTTSAGRPARPLRGDRRSRGGTGTSATATSPGPPSRAASG